MNFMVAIIVTFCVGAFVRDVKMPLSHWLGSGALLLLSSLVFLSFGLLLVQIKSQQIMAIVGNIVFFGLAIIGGSWMPVTLFPKWVQHISEWTPIYHINQLVVNFAKKRGIFMEITHFYLGLCYNSYRLSPFIKSYKRSDHV